jgi:hypothetical protein
VKFSPQPPLRRPQNGTQAHDLSRELEFVRPAQVGYPILGPPSSRFAESKRQNKSVNNQDGSVTDVLNQKCYRCIDCARVSQPQTLSS